MRRRFEPDAATGAGEGKTGGLVESRESHLGG